MSLIMYLCIMIVVSVTLAGFLVRYVLLSNQQHEQIVDLSRSNEKLQSRISELESEVEKIKNDTTMNARSSFSIRKVIEDCASNVKRSMSRVKSESYDLGSMIPLHRSSFDDFSGGWGEDSWTGQDFY